MTTASVQRDAPPNAALVATMAAADDYDLDHVDEPLANAADHDADDKQRANPDAQTTVTDFLDFTEYLPSDIVRSLTLIGKLDEKYTAASRNVHDLTTVWGRLPSYAAHERRDPVQLRADISERLRQAVSSRVFAHAEAVRMAENVARHYNKAKLLVAKLQSMMDNYPAEEVKSPVAPKSPQASRTKLTIRSTGEDGKRISRHRVPRITVPGEVLAPYDIEYNTCSDDSDISTDSESDIQVGGRRTPAAGPRIKLLSSKTPSSRTPKSANRAARQNLNSAAMSAATAANAAALLRPPPENAVIGSADAPWLQLTQYELAKLRKRMKKNATWTPSDTMVARELKALGRGPDEYREAKKKAEEEGRVFEPTVPSSVVVDEDLGTRQLPTGALSADSLVADEHSLSNREMKLNEAKKLKREALAKLAAEEAEESARKMQQAAQLFLGNGAAPDTPKDLAGGAGPTTRKPSVSSRSSGKRKRDVDADAAEPAAVVDEGESVARAPPAKRTKKTLVLTAAAAAPVPAPQPQQQQQQQQQQLKLNTSSSTLASDLFPHGNSALLTPGGSVTATQSETPVPIPVPRQSSSARSAASPASSVSINSNAVTTSVPLKPAAAETPVPLPRTDQRKAGGAVPLPIRDSTKRETRGDIAARSQQHQQQQQQQQQAATGPQPAQQITTEQQQQQPPPPPPPTSRPTTSRGLTPAATPTSDTYGGRRPGSRGKAPSQEPVPSLAADRPRRTSTARNTPAPDFKQLLPPAPPATATTTKRTKRPAPGVVSITSSGGNSAVGKRKAAPKKKARLPRKDKAAAAVAAAETEMEVDDEGNLIDPDEPRYCLCNRVSFGTMIRCDNMEHCKQEWFHLECVGLSDIPARTTKWYCPDCRKLLNIGEKGEVDARGVRK